MIQANNISLSFAKQTIFDKISFIINQSDRIGLIGRNGTGKTTLLKSIVDPSILDSGNISIQKNKKIAYMPQEVVLQSILSVFDEAFTTFKELHELQKEIEKIEKNLNNKINEKEVARYSEIQEHLLKFSVEALKAKTKKVLMGLGFSIEQLDLPVNTFSVGWKMRIVLAKLLLQEADFYLLDEPTNHLDLMAKEWFLNFLKHSEFGFILICHERYFLDELCNEIVELEFGKTIWYNCNYSNYINQKEHNLELLKSAFVQQQKGIKQKQATIERFRASASKSRMALSMEKALEKIERIEIPPSPKNVKFNFPEVQQSGKIVIKVNNVSQKFANKTIFKNVSFEIQRNQKVALIAPNGVGKTTLFNLISGKLPLQNGSIIFGHNVDYATFAQDQNQVLDLDKTVFENIKELCPKIKEQKIRNFLGAFIFDADDIQKKVSVLSGGEKNKVGMVSVLLQQANLLLLDEPTNHLDIPSKDILLKSLQEFNGTLVFVSHDRDFINSLATDIIELTSNGTYHYQGNFDSYLDQKQFNYESNKLNEKEDYSIKKNDSLKTKDIDKIQRKNIGDLEKQILKIEKQIKSINQSFDTLKYGTTEFNLALSKLKDLQNKLKQAEDLWLNYNN